MKTIKKLKIFSAFTGIGGFDLGIMRALGEENVEIIGISEVDKYAIKIYEKHFTDRTNYGDIKKIDTGTLQDFNVFCGGFPCQDISIAGKREGLCGERSGLFFEIIRIIREKQPEFVFLENVKGIFSSNKGWDFARILIEMDESGYDVEWQCLNSKNFGVPQNRERVFIIGHSRREPWKPVFPIGEIDRKPETIQKQICNTITVRYNQSQSTGSYIIENQFDAQRLNQIGVIDKDSEATRVYSVEGLARTIKNGGGMGAKTGLYQIQSHHPRCGNPKKGGTGELSSSEYSYSLDSIPHIVNRIRRLTPLECERLQGYPDGWTAYGSDNKPISDAQRYKCLGNAVTVNVIEAIVQRMI